MIDVVPVGGGVWLARCECEATEHFHSSEAAWAWVLAHPCRPAQRVVDLTVAEARGFEPRMGDKPKPH